MSLILAKALNKFNQKSCKHSTLIQSIKNSVKKQMTKRKRNYQGRQLFIYGNFVSLVPSPSFVHVMKSFIHVSSKTRKSIINHSLMVLLLLSEKREANKNKLLNWNERNFFMLLQVCLLLDVLCPQRKSTLSSICMAPGNNVGT